MEMKRRSEPGARPVPSSVCTETLAPVFLPLIPSSVAIESATVRISYLHLFQIISFTLNCLCKFYKVSMSKLEKLLSSRQEAAAHPEVAESFHIMHRSSVPQANPTPRQL